MRQTLTTGDIAKYCEVNLRTVLRWIERGHLPSYKLPGRGDNRVKTRDFLNFLVDNSMPVPDELRKPDEKTSEHTVLIVEDEPAMASAIQRVLHRHGLNPVIAQDGFRAGLLLSTLKPSLMTLDLGLPGIPGLEVLESVRNNETLKNTRILVISAMSDDVLSTAINYGADDAMCKPFNNKELIRRVDKLLNSPCNLN